MIANYIELISIMSVIGVAIHSHDEVHKLEDWLKSTDWEFVQRSFRTEPMVISQAMIVLLYAGFALYFIMSDHIVAKILFIGAQGSIVFNFLAHIFFKFIWRTNAPGFLSALCFMMPPTILIILYAYQYMDASALLVTEVLIWGAVAHFVAIWLSVHIAYLLYPQAKADQALSKWEDFE